MFHARRAVAIRRKRNVIVRNLHDRLRFSTGDKTTKNSSNNKKTKYQVRRSSIAAEAETEEATSKTNNIFSELWSWYSHKLDTHPLLTKCLTGGVIAASGDVITQVGLYNPAEHQHKKQQNEDVSFWTDVFDVKRTFRFFLLGSCYASPTGHYWYGYLARNHAGTGFRNVTKRVLIDQFAYTPVWTAVWLASLWTMEGQKPWQLQTGMKEHFPDVMVANWILWMPAQYFNFYLVPVKYQVLYTNIVELLWNAYLSFAAAGKGGDHHHHHTTNNKIESSDTKV